MVESAAVARFYESRNNAPIWFRAGPRSEAATQFLTVLHRAPIDGFSQGPSLAAGLQQVLRAAQTGGPVAVQQADRLFSTAWVRYVQAIRAPSRGVIYGTGELARPTAVNFLLTEAAAAPHLPHHVRSVSDINPVYAQLRDAAWNRTQATGGLIERRVRDNLERVRMFPATGRYVIVDIASQQLFMIQDGQVQDRMKVIVGKLNQQTPMIASVIHYATFNPYWNVPDDLVQSVIAANVLKQGTSYLHSRGYEVVADWSVNSPRLSPDRIDWRSVAAGRERIRVRQKPSAANSMGDFKFSFDNPVGIYLHDTPQKELFNVQQRTLSNGCVRLEDARRFASWLLGRPAVSPTSDPEEHVRLAQGVPIFLTYLTVRSDGSRLAFTDDVYGIDRAPEHEMAFR
jgi:murein L,D-transpeptidase YcbB/YkuD